MPTHAPIDFQTASRARPVAGLDPDEEPDTAPRLEVADPAGLLVDSERRWLETYGPLALEALGRAGEVRARVVGDAEMARAHVSHLGEAGTTDVITFDLSEGAELDVDLLVCVDEARRQSAARGHPAERELLLYVVHGVLHCMGFDDHDEAAAMAMHRREDEVLAAIGVGRTFGAPAAGEDV